MASPSVTYNYTATGKAAADQTDQNFSDIVNYISARNAGTASWDDLVVTGPEPWADVRAYGAVGNGTTDDREAIQDAIDAVNGIGGGIVFFPPMDFAIGTILYVPSGVTLIGCGMGASSIIAKSGTFPQNTALIQLGQINGSIYTTASPGSNITIRDIKLNCNGMPAASVDGSAQGIFVPNVSHFLAYRVHIVGTQGYGIHLAADAGTYGLIAPHIIECILEDCGNRNNQDSIGGGYNTGAVIAFCNFISPNGTAIDNVHVENALWIGNRSVGAVSPNGQIWSDFGMVRSRIVDNYIENGSIHVYGYLAGGGQEAPHSVLIHGNHIKSGGSAAIYVSAANQVLADTGVATNIRITSNIIEGCVDDGIVLEDAPGAVVANNVINNWDTGGGGADAAIELRGGPNPAIGSTGCVIGCNAGVVGGSTLYYNESTSAQTGNNIVFGNNFPSGTVTLDTGGTQSTFVIETPSTFKKAVTMQANSNITFANSGANVSLVVSNTSNTASSNALLNLKVAGTSANDPYTYYEVTSGTSFACGVDNSDSDKFKISRNSTLGTNDDLIITSSGAVSLRGTATNDAAAAGYVGEYITATGAGTAAATSGEYGDITSISLTAGDWIVSANAEIFQNGATYSGIARAGISTTSGNSSSGLTVGDNLIEFVPSAAQEPVAIAGFRVSLSATTSVYFKSYATYSAGGPLWYGRISAHRVR